MECPQCHKTIDDDSSFCKYCGLVIDEKQEKQPRRSFVRAKPKPQSDDPMDLYMDRDEYFSHKSARGKSSFLISLAFPAIVILFILVSYLFAIAS